MAAPEGTWNGLGPWSSWCTLKLEPRLQSVVVKRNFLGVEEIAVALVASMVGPHTAAEDTSVQLCIASATAILAQDYPRRSSGRGLGDCDLEFDCPLVLFT
ncbi:hypothetical protein N9L68_09055 [bacterium]|nr:hypothetical protein [bacterium]